MHFTLDKVWLGKLTQKLVSIQKSGVQNKKTSLKEITNFIYITFMKKASKIATETDIWYTEENL